MTRRLMLMHARVGVVVLPRPDRLMLPVLGPAFFPRGEAVCAGEYERVSRRPHFLIAVRQLDRHKVARPSPRRV